MKDFTLNDIHSGYVVQLRNGELMICIRVNQANFTKILVNNQRFMYMSAFDENFKHKGHRYCIDKHAKGELDIVKVYGLVNAVKDYTICYCPSELSLEDRPLLWSNRKKLRIRLKDLCDMLDADVEIVEEDK